MHLLQSGADEVDNGMGGLSSEGGDASARAEPTVVSGSRGMSSRARDADGLTGVGLPG